VPDDARRTLLSEAILQHLRTHAFAADTPEGIVSNWLPSAGFADAPDHIDAVLDKMTHKGWLRARPLPDGRVLYTRGDAQL
jgi:hypothetical protein